MAQTATVNADAKNAMDLPELVRELERRIDDAYAAFGDLAGALPRARRELKLSAVVGQGVLDHFTNAGAAIAAARGHSVSGHRLIDKVAAAIGFEVVATGDESDKPNDFIPPSAGIQADQAVRSVEPV